LLKAPRLNWKPVLDAAEGLRGQLHADELLRAFPSTVAAAYDALVDVRLAQGRVDEAMWSADASRSRAMTELDVAPGGNLTERGALDAQLDATYDRLLALDGSVSLDLRRQLDARARDLEARLGRVRLDALRSTPRPKRRGSTDRERPADGEVQAIYRVAGDRIGVFVRHGDEVAFEADVARVPDVVAHLEAFRSIGRQAVALAGAGPAVTRRLVPPAAARLAWLGDHLLAPLEAHLGAARRVVVVPHAILHGVPFHALTTAGRPLLDHVEVAVAPSLSWRTSGGRRSTAGRTVVIGYGGPELPGVDAEVDAIVRLLPESIVLRHGEATIDAVRSAIQGASCVHLATHGTFRPGAPLQSGIRLADGWLSARALAQFDLRGAMVVLSACDTGRTVVDAGDELLGLQRGFWLAGARSIVMSLWPAVDEAAVTTMTALHTGVLEGLDDTAAIRRSWQVAREHHPHPWWWAPFIAVER